MQRLDAHLRAVTRAALAGQGAAFADLLTHWRAIVGEDLAAITRPTRLKRPRDPERTGGALLLVRAAEGHALEVQHEASRIVERINGFFGYGAVEALKILQGPLPAVQGRSAAVRAVPEAVAEAVEASVAGIPDPRLKDALRRLGRSRAVSSTSR